VWGRIDILVNVAGGSGPMGKTGWETTPEDFDEIVTLNMNGCFHTMRAVVPAMIRQRSGKIVNVGGTFGMRGRAGRMAYSASKWGLRGITKSFALEVGEHNINVNCVAPGMVDGPRFREKVVPTMAKKLGISQEEAARRHAEDYALKRITLDEDIANACLFMASDVSRQITGVDLPVDGGWAAL
jgi:NAD(P)-dependent dehydrogenase (short-subunit alcohol dehydrogenase family)